MHWYRAAYCLQCEQHNGIVFQSLMKTMKLDALPDGGRKLRDEILFLSENLRRLDVRINSSKHAQTGTVNGRCSYFIFCWERFLTTGKRDV